MARNMVLSDSDLRRAMAGGELELQPFSERNLTPNGYDFTVESVLVPSTGERTEAGTARVPAGAWFVVGTRERVRLGRGLAGQLWLRSTFARKGILATFGKIDAGFDGTLTVTALNASPSGFELPIGERFCQMVVERLDSPAEKAYAERSGRYQHQKGITLDARDAEAAGSRQQAATGKGTEGTGQRAGADERTEGRGQGAATDERTARSGQRAGPSPSARPWTSEARLGRNDRPRAGRLRCTLNAARSPVDQPCQKHGCDACCRTTEMPLTRADVRRIRALGFEEGDFVEVSDGWLRLRNTAEGRCFFLRKGLCSIYPHRPEGCALYPLVFDIDAGRAVLDPECPHRDEYRPADGSGPAVRRLVDRLGRERRERRRRVR